MHPVLSFVIPVRNDEVRLRRCLETVRANAADVETEIIVIDNGSSDASAAVAEAAGARVITLPDRTVSELRNTGARAATGALLAFVDADHELAPDWAVAAVSIFTPPGVAAAGAQYHAPPDGTWLQRMYDRLRRRQTGRQPVDWIPSGNLLVRASAFDAIGGFDTALETCEDVDLCRRLRARGCTIIEAEELRSVHRGDPTTLRALFLGELWRGRDNLRVSLRRPGVLKALPSLLHSIGVLVGLFTLVGGLIAWPIVGPGVAAGGGAMVGALIAVRAASLLRRTPAPDRSGRAVLHAVLVGGTYDVARACALVTGGSHDVRRRSEPLAGVVESPNRGVR